MEINSLVIGDVIVGGQYAYEWQIPLNLKPDTSLFKITISDVKQQRPICFKWLLFTITFGVTGYRGWEFR